MRLLLDTHALLWWLAADPRLSEQARDAVADSLNESIVSAATVWEVAIKRSLGKLDVPGDLLPVLRAHEFSVLAVTGEHADAVADLPWHHRDPFDRLLVAQARAERLCVVSGDPAFSDYRVPVLW